MIKLSIVIPVYFNEKNIPPLYEKLRSTIIENRNFEYELVFVDDGSGDDSFSELRR